MSKLFNLRAWLTLDEAAQHLSVVMQEPVSVLDILRFGHEGRLKLSTNLLHDTRAIYGWKVKSSEAGFELRQSFRALMQGKPHHEAYATFPRHEPRRLQLEWKAENKWVEGPDYYLVPRGIRTGVDEILDWSSPPVPIGGVWDLPLAGGALLVIENALRKEMNERKRVRSHDHGFYVQSTDEVLYALIRAEEPSNLHGEAKKNPPEHPLEDDDHEQPASRSPYDTKIVVRPASLSTFIASLSGPAERQDKPLTLRERNSMLRIIRALDVMAKLPSRGFSSSIQHQLETLGFTYGPKDSTINKHVKHARALEPDDMPKP